MTRLLRSWVGAVILGLLSVPIAFAVPMEAAAAREKGHIVSDMRGRSVLVPYDLRRVATVGGCPIINTFIFALKKGGTIVNGLPVTARVSQKDCCRFQPVFAGQLDGQPSVEQGNGGVSIETLLSLHPDVVVTAQARYFDIIKSTGIPTVFIETGKTGEKTKEIMRVLGKVYGRESEAEHYIRYFDSVMKRVREGTRAIPEKDRARVLYCNIRRMDQSSSTADWWIEAAGGISLGKGGPVRSGTRSFSAEQVLAWNPDVWIVSTPQEVDTVYGDVRFRAVKAVKSKRVFFVPTGSLRWSHPTSEEPLGVLWAAKAIYPERFRSVNMEEETRKFYLTFFGYRLTDGQVGNMLGYQRQ